MKCLLMLIGLVGLLTACAGKLSPVIEDAAAQVTAAEGAFAQAMADRDFEAFAAFVDENAVFFTNASPLRGKPQVLDGWRHYFETPEPPFSWTPEEVVVLASGDLAHSSGPVRNAAGKVVARFNSVWRLGPDGRWRVVFDKGNRVCD